MALSVKTNAKAKAIFSLVVHLLSVSVLRLQLLQARSAINVPRKHYSLASIRPSSTRQEGHIHDTLLPQRNDLYALSATRCGLAQRLLSL
jgi:hypothetical protein